MTDYNHDAIVQRQQARQRPMTRADYFSEACERLAEAEADLTEALQEVERLQRIVTEWSDRFGFLAEPTYTRDSFEAADEVARLISVKQDKDRATPARLVQERDSLRLERDAAEHNRVKENAYLLQRAEQAAARLAAVREALEQEMANMRALPEMGAVSSEMGAVSNESFWAQKGRFAALRWVAALHAEAPAPGEP